MRHRRQVIPEPSAQTPESEVHGHAHGDQAGRGDPGNENGNPAHDLDLQDCCRATHGLTLAHNLRVACIAANPILAVTRVTRVTTMILLHFSCNSLNQTKGYAGYMPTCRVTRCNSLVTFRAGVNLPPLQRCNPVTRRNPALRSDCEIVGVAAGHACSASRKIAGVTM